jgi:hypothetical protein
MGRSDFLKNTIIGVTLGIVGGIVVGVLLGKQVAVPNMKKWRNRMESKQLDAEIRLDLLEYNHLHEDEHLRVIL